MDQLAGQTPAIGASVDIEKVKADFTAMMEERMKGFQRLVSGRDETIKALNKELEEFKTAGLSEEERYQLQLERKQKEIEELQSKLELRDLSSRYGDEMPYFERLLAAQNAEEQLEVMRELRAKASGSQAQAPAEEPAIPQVDPNNPPRSFDPNTRMMGDVAMNDALADQILGSWGRA